eukprot:m.190830 g.190830  ORF g.190830 m.190830 type:complete len:165 (-) comp53630_c1_seq39:1112-1606(-)
MAHRDISTAPSRDDLGRQVSYTVLPPTVASDSIVVYKRRWWLLFVVCCLVFEQGFIWNTWGPIATSVKTAFHWSNGTISLLASWGGIALLIAMFPVVMILDRKGLRPAFLLGTSLCLVGTALRCFTSENEVRFECLMRALPLPTSLGCADASSHPRTWHTDVLF